LEQTDLHCDVAIIGAGTAGLAAERAARTAGASTLLIDDRFAGTTCANVGCMPSKLLIAAAHAAHAVRTASVFGIIAPEPVVDGVAVMARLRLERDRFVDATLSSIEQIPADIRQRARAHFIDATTLALDDDRKVFAKAVVIATGSSPTVPPMFKVLGDRILTNETIFELRDLPKSVAVIGAGPLGLELAQALARLGVDTAVFDHADGIAGLKDTEVQAELRAILENELPLHIGVELEVQAVVDGARLSWTGSTKGAQTFERVLVATGRPPQLKDLNLHNTGLALDKKGVPLFDPATLQCGAAPIFLIGDANADRPVLHEASSQGAIAGQNAAGFPNVEPIDRGGRLSIMFTDPPLAVIGEPAGAGAVIGSASYADQGRAKVEARNKGLVRIYAAPTDGRLTGATLLGPGMEHIGHLLAWAIERGETASGLLDLPFYHPTFEEGLKSALRDICKKVHSPLPRRRDEGVAAGG